LGLPDKVKAKDLRSFAFFDLNT